jgi:hypothetical protein
MDMTANNWMMGMSFMGCGTDDGSDWIGALCVQVDRCRARQGEAAYARALEFLKGHGQVGRRGSAVSEGAGGEDEPEDQPPEPIVEDEADDQDLALLSGIRRHGFLWHMWNNCGWFTLPMILGMIIEVWRHGDAIAGWDAW